MRRLEKERTSDSPGSASPKDYGHKRKHHGIYGSGKRGRPAGPRYHYVTSAVAAGQRSFARSQEAPASADTLDIANGGSSNTAEEYYDQSEAKDSDGVAAASSEEEEKPELSHAVPPPQQQQPQQPPPRPPSKPLPPAAGVAHGRATPPPPAVLPKTHPPPLTRSPVKQPMPLPQHPSPGSQAPHLQSRQQTPPQQSIAHTTVVHDVAAASRRTNSPVVQGSPTAPVSTSPHYFSPPGGDQTQRSAMPGQMPRFVHPGFGQHPTTMLMQYPSMYQAAAAAGRPHDGPATMIRMMYQPQLGVVPPQHPMLAPWMMAKPGGAPGAAGSPTKAAEVSIGPRPGSAPPLDASNQQA